MSYLRTLIALRRDDTRKSPSASRLLAASPPPSEEPCTAASVPCVVLLADSISVCASLEQSVRENPKTVVGA
jgi:hypothetical protein